MSQIPNDNKIPNKTYQKPSFNILERIDREKRLRGWSDYKLAESAGLKQSTISTWRKREIQPSVASIEQICHGLGITLSEFFANEDVNGEYACITYEQAELLRQFNLLNEKQRRRFLEMLQSINE